MSFDLRSKLSKLYEQKKLGHFYIIKLSSNNLMPVNAQEHLKDWILQLLQEDFKIPRPQNHPDILWIEPARPSGYTVKEGELGQILHFQNFRPLELSHRFIIVEQSHLINETLVNKLLKELESPAQNTTLFFLNPSQKSFLATLESRAIGLSIPIKSKAEYLHKFNQQKSLNSLDELKVFLNSEKMKFKESEHLDESSPLALGLNFYCNFIEETLKRSQTKLTIPYAWALNEITTQKIDEATLMYWWLTIESLKKSSFQHKSKSIEILEWAQRVSEFRNPALSRYEEILSQTVSW